MSLNNLLSDALEDLGYSGAVSDMLYEFYRDNGVYNEREWLQTQLGTNVSLNDLKYAYLSSLGYTGALNDMFRQALLDGVYFTETTGVWLLATGAWDDAGQWEDSNIWID